MSETYVLGIDAGGTHTDAVLLACDAAAEEQAPGEICAAGLGAEALPSARLVASAKARTRHDNLPASVREVLAALATAAPGCDFGAISRVNARPWGAPSPRRPRCCVSAFDWCGGQVKFSQMAG